MKQLAKASRMHDMLGMLVGILFLCVLLPSTGLCAPKADDVRIPFVLPTLKPQSMPQVFFSHERHVERLESVNKDCTACHVDGPKGMSEYFLDSEKMSAKKVVAYVHNACVQCHTAMPSPTGPALASCRACHNSSIEKAQNKTAASKK